MSFREKIRVVKERLLKPLTSFQLYWVAYGGWSALFCSLYLWLSIMFAIIACYANYDVPKKWAWADAASSIVPSILGFSLGGYAMLVGFGDEKFLNALRCKDEDEKFSPYMKVNASFLHFIFIQFLCIIFSSIAKMLHLEDMLFFYFIGTTIFFYALFTIISTSLSILNLADWFDFLPRINHINDDGDNKKDE